MSNSRRCGHLHKTVRNRWRLKVEAGGVACARCGEPIEPGTAWDLGHVDGGRPGEYAGPEHRKCNRAAPPIAAWKALAAAQGGDDARSRGRASSRCASSAGAGTGSAVSTSAVRLAGNAAGRVKTPRMAPR